MPDAFTLQTNFGNVAIAAGTAPQAIYRGGLEVAEFEAAISLASEKGFAVIRGMSDEALEQTTRYIASAKKLLYKEHSVNFITIGPRPDPNSVAYTDRYLALHSDNAYMLRRPNYIFFYMRQAAAGGDSLITTIRELEPTFEKVGAPLAGIPLRTYFKTVSGAQRVFVKEGERRDITYSPFATYYEFQSPGDFETFSRIASAIEETVTRYAVRLENGDAMIIDNRLCLHGRHAFFGEREALRAWFS
jgi:hypothetical protein